MADLDLIKYQVKRLNLPNYDTNLLISYICEDPERRMPKVRGMPTDTLPKKCKKHAFKNLVKLLRKRESTTMQDLIDEDDDVFFPNIETVINCKTFFSANKNIRKLYKDLLENLRSTLMLMFDEDAPAPSEQHKQFQTRFDKLKKQKNGIMYVIELDKNVMELDHKVTDQIFDAYDDLIYDLINELSSVYENINSIREKLDAKFSF